MGKNGQPADINHGMKWYKSSVARRKNGAAGLIKECLKFNITFTCGANIAVTTFLRIRLIHLYSLYLLQ